MMMLSCLEAKCCLHMIPGCICDGDPTQMTDVVERLRSAKACTQKTFLHSPDWSDGRQLLDEAIQIIEQGRDEIRMLRIQLEQARDTITRMAKSE